MQEQFLRTAILLGEEAMDKLHDSHVAVFGIGGVGGHTVEALVRSGIGKITIVDNDIVDITNLNRQLLATTKTVGRNKVEVMQERILEINPECAVTAYACFYLPETAERFDFSAYDYIVDAVDTVTAKIDLAVKAEAAGIPIISSMGAGNKLDAARFEAADIYQTSVCPLAKVMRKELKARNINALKVVYSKETPMKPLIEIPSNRRSVPGSTAFVPAVAGLIIAGEVIKDITGVWGNVQ